MENSKKSALQELTNGGINKSGGHPLGYMPPNTPKKKYESGITYSCRKYLGSKKNLPIQVLKTANNFPLRFPSIIDLINVMGYKK